VNGLPDARDFAALDALLCEALARPASEREAFVASACAGDPAAERRLRHLLAAAQSTAPWERAAYAAPAWREALDDLLGEGAPARVGEWRVGAEIGRGGMARVHRAERDVGGFRQVAALKVIAPGALSDDTRARFEQERRILADLADARIARLYDGGLLPDGRPWLAMELVEGVRIDSWCDKHGLDVSARVRLLLELVGAVTSAHRSLVIHRDIKPGNALVTADGQVKLLDFGIAKILRADADGAATATAMGALTPHYASPEQLSGSAVTTATDVYQLGLLLYELLCGRRPHQSEETTFPRLAHALLETDPPPFAECLRGHGTALAAVAAARATTPRKLRRALSGDLQRVVLKALARDPAARYESAASFGEDLRRALSGEPVRAAPAGAAYRLRRFVSRHRLGVAAATALLTSLAVGVVTTAWQAREALIQRDQARIEAEKARQLSQFMVSVFANADPHRTQGMEVSAKVLLDQARDRIATELPRRDEIRSDLLAAMASAYGGLGLRAERLPLTLEALDVERGLARPEILARRLAAAAEVLRDDARATEAKTLLDEAIKLLEADPASSRALLGHVQYLQGMTHFSLREHPASIAWLERAVATLGSAPDARAEDIEAAKLMLSRRWATFGRMPEALALVEEVVVTLRAAQPPRPSDLIGALDALGSAYSKAGRTDEHIATYREALALATRTLGADHFDVAVLNHNLAGALHVAGDVAAARTHSDTALAVGARSVGPTHNFMLPAAVLNARLHCLDGDIEGGRRTLTPLLPELPRLPQIADRVAAARAACGID
jgi:serine/threonine-protein kinase